MMDPAHILHYLSHQAITWFELRFAHLSYIQLGLPMHSFHFGRLGGSLGGFSRIRQGGQTFQWYYPRGNGWSLVGKSSIESLVQRDGGRLAGVKVGGVVWSWRTVR